MVYDGHALTTLLDEFTHRYTKLRFSTALHGGFKTCEITVPMPLEEAWLYLARENLPGRHFDHIRITEDQRIVWEGRIMDISLVVETDAALTGGGLHGLEILGMGYWSSCRDRKYDPADAGNTDWTASGPHEIDDIIKEMLNDECPDISTDQSNIAAQTQDVVGIDLTARAYPMDNIIDKLMPLADSVSHFAIWDGRVPYLTARSVAQVDVVVRMDALPNLRLTQQGKHLRNYVLPVVGTTEGTGASNADSQALYPRRDLSLTLSDGVSATVANNARDNALTERANPRQDSSFQVQGAVYSSSLATPGALSGALQQIPKWRVRAGDVVRIMDLVPASAATPALDDLRTFFILETVYDAVADNLEVQPDRPAGPLSALLARIGQLELAR